MREGVLFAGCGLESMLCFSRHYNKTVKGTKSQPAGRSRDDQPYRLLVPRCSFLVPALILNSSLLLSLRHSAGKPHDADTAVPGTPGRPPARLAPPACDRRPASSSAIRPAAALPATHSAAKPRMCGPCGAERIGLHFRRSPARLRARLNRLCRFAHRVGSLACTVRKALSRSRRARLRRAMHGAGVQRQALR